MMKDELIGDWEVCDGSPGLEPESDDNHPVFAVGQKVSIRRAGTSPDRFTVQAAVFQSEAEQARKIRDRTIQGVYRVRGHLHDVTFERVSSLSCHPGDSRRRHMVITVEHHHYQPDHDHDVDEPRQHDGTYHTHDDD